VVANTESNILLTVMVRLTKLPRGLRPWHVTHGYDTATRETLSVLTEDSVEYGNPSDNKTRKPVALLQGNIYLLREEYKCKQNWKG